jgi:hypothetical protein
VRPDQLADLWRQEMAREKVVAHFPQALPALDGQPLTLRGDLRNVSAVPQSVAVRVVAGLNKPVVDPPTARLEPAQVAPVTVSGLPTAPSVELEISGAFGTRREAISLRLTRLSELLAPLPEGAKLSPVAYFEATQLPHRSGAEEPDHDALGGSAWVARSGQAEAGFVIFGPYAPLPAGPYAALFRVKRLGTGTGLFATLDTCVGGGTPQTGRADLRAESLPEGQYRLCPVVFNHPGGPFETRVQWTAAAPLAVDGIGLWKVEGPGAK